MSNTVEQKKKEYIEYIDNHQANVWNAWCKNMNLFLDIFPFLSDLVNQKKIQNNIIIHDKSKYSDEEFEPYRIQFFSINDKEKEGNKENFDMAWKHHYTNNMHHWNYWVNEKGEAKEMDDFSIIEMICDWMAMGVQFNNTAAEYYEKNKDKINLASNTRIKVESILIKI